MCVCCWFVADFTDGWVVKVADVALILWYFDVPYGFQSHYNPSANGQTKDGADKYASICVIFNFMMLRRCVLIIMQPTNKAFVKVSAQVMINHYYYYYYYSDRHIYLNLSK